MEKALENLSKEDLIKVVSSRDQEIDYLKTQLAMYRRMQFGQSRERFEGDPNQTTLPFEAGSEQIKQQQQEIREKIEYTRTRVNHKGRAKLPEHLPEKLRSTPKVTYLKWYVLEKRSQKNWNASQQSSI